MSGVSIGKPVTTLFKRLGAFIRRNPKSGGRFETYSKFKRFFESMKPDDPLYPSVRQAAGLCDDALRMTKRRIKLGAQIHEADEKLNEMACYNNLSEAEAKKLSKLLDYYISLTAERSMLFDRLSDFDASLSEMFKLEEDAVAAMPQIKNAEQQQRLLRQDLSYIQGEKAELTDERAAIDKGLWFIRRFTVGMIGAFVVAAIGLTYLYIIQSANIFWPVSILIVLVILVAALLYGYQRKLRYEMRLNFRKQHRAIELLNKKNIVFVYYTNYLRYSYRKYKVRNSKALADNLEDLNKYKYLLGRIDTVRSILYETEADIERFLREKRMTGINASIENFARTINLEDKRRYLDGLQTQRQKAEAELNTLDARHEEIWETLMVLHERDTSHNKIIEKIIQTYLDEAARLLDGAGEPLQLADEGTEK